PVAVNGAALRWGNEIRSLLLLDDLPVPAFESLARVPHATARLLFDVFATPFGTQRCDVHYHFLSRTTCLLSDLKDSTDVQPAFGAPEMHVSMSFRNYLKMRSGQVTALEAIEDGGSVDARWTLLLLLHGMIQSPEYVAAYRGLPVLPDELGWWGEVAPHIPPA